MTRKALCIIFGAALACALAVITPAARANAWNQATRMTFNQPVELPGNVILPAGTYWFTVPEGTLVSSLVRVYNADQTKVLATMMTIPTGRMNVTSHTQLTFGEQSKNQPIALMDWYYPDFVTGHQFVYSPREEAKLSESEKITVTARHAPLVQVARLEQVA